MKIKHQILTYTTLCLLSPLLITLLLINSTSALTKTSTANAAIRVRSTCSMTATIDSGNEHTATMINGQYRNDIGLTTIQTFCNDPNGYAIYAIGYTGEDAGVAAGTNTVLHSNALGSTYDIVTGIAQSGDTSNWAMKLASVDGTYKPDILSDDNGSFSDYHIVPQSYTKVASFNTNTDLDNPASTRQGSKLTTTYAAYISPTQDAGTYEGAVKYVLVNPSNIDDPYYMQTVETWGSLIAVGQEVTAYDTRDNKSYTVRRMCMEGTGSTWQEKEANCTSSMLWMTQNLDLCVGCAGTKALTSENTNITEYQKNGVNFAGYTTDAYGLITWSPTAPTMTGTPAYITTTSGATVSGYINDYNIPYMTEGGDRYSYQGARYNSLQECEAANHNAAECAHYHIGNYYNWSASVAMSNTSSYVTNYTVMPNSICPKGWRLPNGITQDLNDNTIKIQSDFNRLLHVYDITNGTDLTGSGNVGWKSNGFINIGLTPLYFVISGYINSSSLSMFNQESYYWSSTASSNAQAYNLSYDLTKLAPAAQYNRGIGRPARCVSDY